MTAYFDELEQRFPGGFDPGDTLVADADQFRDPQGRFLIGRIDGSIACCGGVYLLEPCVAEIKRMWVASEVRGRGVGGDTLTELERLAGELGATAVRLDTNSVLTVAIAMYTSRGYVPIESYNNNPYAQRWFEKPLVAN